LEEALPLFLYISHIKSLYDITNKPDVRMKIEIEFKTESSNASELSQKLSPILNAVKQQGLDAREFSLEMDTGSDGGGPTQFSQKISSVLDSMNQQGLKAKEVELEVSTGSSDIAPSMQKISAVINTIKEQGFEVKELEVDAEKEE
jgi:flagellar hook-basal body complex protein FliE